MTSLADRSIASLRALHDDLVSIVSDLTPEQVSGPSGASAWNVAQVLSHLGSGAEIGLGTLNNALTGAEAPENAEVWARWDGMDDATKAVSFPAASQALVAAFEALTAEQRSGLMIDMGFLPAPIPVATFTGMRLNEVTLHAWDVRVPFDPNAGLDDTAAGLLAEHLAGDISFLLGFIGKADQLATPALVDIQDSGYAISVADTVALVPTSDATNATFSGPLEAAVRLIGGRLTPEYTPDSVDLIGHLTLDDLRKVFPGY